MVTRGLLVGGLCALAIACSANRKQATPASVQRSPIAAAPSRMDRSPISTGPSGMAARDEIEVLDREIEAALTRVGLRPTPRPLCAVDGNCSELAPTPMGIKPAAEDPTCKPGPSDTCKDSCNLSDSICKNADRICVLAQQLGGTDAYANETCERGNASCKASRERCCGCM